jgi:hypothetical protein
VLKQKTLSDEHQNLSDVRFAQACRDELVDFGLRGARQGAEGDRQRRKPAVAMALAAVQSARETRPVTLSPG